MVENEQNANAYENLSEEGKVKRFLELRSLFQDENEITDESLKNRGNFLSFMNNAYKYPDRFHSHEGFDDQKLSSIFNQAASGLQLIRPSLDYYLQVNRNRSGVPNNNQDTYKSLLEAIAIDNGRFANVENGQLDVDRLKEMVKWSLNAYARGGENIGRKPGIEEGQVEQLADDLEAILKQVNSFN